MGNFVILSHDVTATVSSVSLSDLFCVLSRLAPRGDNKAKYVA